MAGLISWASGVIQSGNLQLSGQGAALNNAAAVALAVVLDNRGVSGGPAFFLNTELLTSQSGFGGNVAANSEIELYLVPSLDGTNFPVVDTAGAVLPATSFVGSFITTVSGNAAAAASSVRIGLGSVPLMPLKYQGYIKNNTGQTLTSGWSVAFGTYEDYYA